MIAVAQGLALDVAGQGELAVLRQALRRGLVGRRADRAVGGAGGAIRAGHAAGPGRLPGGGTAVGRAGVVCLPPGLAPIRRVHGRRGGVRGAGHARAPGRVEEDVSVLPPSLAVVIMEGAALLLVLEVGQALALEERRLVPAITRHVEGEAPLFTGVAHVLVERAGGHGAQTLAHAEHAAGLDEHVGGATGVRVDDDVVDGAELFTLEIVHLAAAQIAEQPALGRGFFGHPVVVARAVDGLPDLVGGPRNLVLVGRHRRAVVNFARARGIHAIICLGVKHGIRARRQREEGRADEDGGRGGDFGFHGCIRFLDTGTRAVWHGLGAVEGCARASAPAAMMRPWMAHGAVGLGKQAGAGANRRATTVGHLGGPAPRGRPRAAIFFGDAPRTKIGARGARLALRREACLRRGAADVPDQREKRDHGQDTQDGGGDDDEECHAPIYPRPRVTIGGVRPTPASRAAMPRAWGARPNLASGLGRRDRPRARRGADARFCDRFFGRHRLFRLFGDRLGRLLGGRLGFARGRRWRRRQRGGRARGVLQLPLGLEPMLEGAALGTARLFPQRLGALRDQIGVGRRER